MMTMSTFLAQRNMSRYQLSKSSGIPWATLADICSGKTKLERCNGATLQKLARTLHISIEDLLLLENVEPHNGFPSDSSYLEADLPQSLQLAIREYAEGVASGSALLDCLWGELYGAINAHQHGGRITAEQADYLRMKYLFEGEENS